jgi:hypothetical protein
MKVSQYEGRAQEGAAMGNHVQERGYTHEKKLLWGRIRMGEH